MQSFDDDTSKSENAIMINAHSRSNMLILNSCSPEKTSSHQVERMRSSQKVVSYDKPRVIGSRHLQYLLWWIHTPKSQSWNIWKRGMETSFTNFPHTFMIPAYSHVILMGKNSWLEFGISLSHGTYLQICPYLQVHSNNPNAKSPTKPRHSPGHTWFAISVTSMATHCP